jgi:hypothetical protein
MFRTYGKKNFEIYGISQNPDTNDYILVQNYLINLINWKSGNEIIDDFIQEMQLSDKNKDNVIFEWIPYDQFSEIKEAGENKSIIVYSAIWKDGPLCLDYSYVSCYKRILNKEVTLKCLQNSQNNIEVLINEV